MERQFRRAALKQGRDMAEQIFDDCLQAIETLGVTAGAAAGKILIEDTDGLKESFTEEFQELYDVLRQANQVALGLRGIRGLTLESPSFTYPIQEAAEQLNITYNKRTNEKERNEEASETEEAKDGTESG